MKLRMVVVLFLFLLWIKEISLAEPFIDALLRDEIWDDGLAEISIYDAIEVRYGLPRETEVRHILVKETFSAKSMVKADNWQESGAYEVIKLNQIIKVPTGSYDYYQMHTNFWRKQTGALEKFSLASIDSCGNSYKEGRIRKGVLHYEARTYWQGMDHVERKQKLSKQLLFYDELPWKLRTLAWRNDLEFSAKLIPTMVTSRADNLQTEEVKILVNQDATVWRVLVQGAAEDTFLFAKEPPYELLSWKKRDGGELKRRVTVRIPYWQLNKPGDEKIYQTER